MIQLTKNYFEWSRQRSGARMAFRNILLPKSPERFTSVFPVSRTFGMGTGPSSQLWPPAPKIPAFRQIIKHSQMLLRFAVTRIGMTSVTSGFEKNLLRLFAQAATEAVENAGVGRIDAMQVAKIMSRFALKQEHFDFLVVRVLDKEGISGCNVEGACAHRGISLDFFLGGLGECMLRTL
jgi:hypothetical protein